MQHLPKFYDHSIPQNIFLKTPAKRCNTVRRNNGFKEVVNLFHSLFPRENQVANFRLNVRKIKDILTIVFKETE